jgi:hypothetical protein
MMAALIFAVSLATLFMFFVSYCRSMVASAAQHELSEEVRDVTGINQAASAGDYTRVMQILELCPDNPDDRIGLRAVNLYYSCLKMGQQIFLRAVPSMNSWTEHEQASCAYFAAVALDRRISFNREMLTRQAES